MQAPRAPRAAARLAASTAVSAPPSSSRSSSSSLLPDPLSVLDPPTAVMLVLVGGETTERGCMSRRTGSGEARAASFKLSSESWARTASLRGEGTETAMSRRRPARRRRAGRRRWMVTSAGDTSATAATTRRSSSLRDVVNASMVTGRLSDIVITDSSASSSSSPVSLNASSTPLLSTSLSPSLRSLSSAPSLTSSLSPSLSSVEETSFSFSDSVDSSPTALVPSELSPSLPSSTSSSLLSDSLGSCPTAVSSTALLSSPESLDSPQKNRRLSCFCFKGTGDCSPAAVASNAEPRRAINARPEIPTRLSAARGIRGQYA
mmetsp:Transcript_22209/g.44717  ORF Transcript_22209/g.44717 Transcript_22209/m.44717 type:complete len:319 (+) Transcript_22209:373-1329(+)